MIAVRVGTWCASRYEATPGPQYKGKETASEWSVGIAHAKSPRGPWVKSAANPVINETIVGFDGFYVAAVMVVNGSIWMYRKHPVALPGNSTFSIVLRFGSRAAAIGTNSVAVRCVLLGYYKNVIEIG